MITILPSPQSAKQWFDQQRQKNLKIGFVPTMGALHQGHLSLVARSVKDNNVTCASIFINPLQFNNLDDLEKYPGNSQADVESLEKTGCSMIFTGTLEQFFPEANDPGEIQYEDPGPRGNGLEGEFRPGHLEGVVTIVRRLFSTVGSCNAYFGEKDYQQTLVVHDLARNMENEGIHINVIICPTIREDSGLAMSSRNQRLTERQKIIANRIYLALAQAKQSWEAGLCDADRLEKQMQDQLNHSEIFIDYAAIRDQDKWTTDTPDFEISNARALVAATVGEVRLIDNLYLGSRKL